VWFARGPWCRVKSRRLGRHHFLQIRRASRRMLDVECIGDRFVPAGGDHAIDLATGDHVRLVITRAGDGIDQRAWASRCDDEYLTRGRSATVLVDYGLHGESHRFEAWSAKCSVAGAHRVEASLAELFEADRRSACALRIFGPSGIGKSALLMRVARSARLHG